MTVVYKIVCRSDWHAAQETGTYVGSADDRRDGFIHLSAADQVEGTLRKHFKGQDDLLLIAFDSASLGASLRWEASRGGQLFPHVYGNLPCSLALWQRPLNSGADGVATILDQDLT